MVFHYVMSSLSLFMLILGVLISVAFMILLERKVLGYIQLRKGPNKVGISGVIQSFSDAIKLFIKEQISPFKSNSIFYYFSPCFAIFVVLILWVALPKDDYCLNYFFSGLFFFCCTSFSVYSMIGSGWSSNSNYSLVGAIRGVAQTISYEASMAIFFITLIFFSVSYDLSHFLTDQLNMPYVFMFLPLFFCWYISSLAETNRTPFDFAEGESELVSGFNIEYGSGGFALIFLAEYASIIFMSYLMVVLFLGVSFLNFFYFNFFSVFLVFSFIWVRSCFPRFRYDKLMNVAWKVFLPISLFTATFYFCVMTVQI